MSSHATDIVQAHILAYSGRFTHINGYTSAAGPVQASESSPVRNRRSTTELHRQQYTAVVGKVSVVNASCTATTITHNCACYVRNARRWKERYEKL